MNFMKLYVILAIAGLTTGFSVRAIAQEKEPSLTEQDREQIVAVGKTNDEAWSKSDAVALAALFTDDAIFVTPGATLSGREAIEKRYQDVFQGLKKKLVQRNG
jgi:SnoaL-like domain